jgi:hypothetical protein
VIGPKYARNVSTRNNRAYLSACNRPDDEERLFARNDCFGQRSVRRFVSEIFLTGKKPKKRAAL